MRSIAIIGFSTAGLVAAETLRREGFTGDLTIVCGESHWPYDRPPLSKGLLLGQRTTEQLALRPEHTYDALEARTLRGVKATALDVEGRRLTLDTGERVCADGIVIATGVAARRLPGSEKISGLYTVRDFEDTLSLQAALPESGRVIVIGAGVLGLEVAASAKKLGHDVTVVDEAPLPCVRQFGPWVAARVAALHESRGVRLLMNTGVRRIDVDENGRARGVELGSGLHLHGDVVVVAIGSVPATEWLAGSGIPLSNGLDGDQYCQVAPGIVAAGDVASWVDADGHRVRAEDKTNAVMQGAAAARRLLGSDRPYDPVSFFWSEQHDVLIQAYGRCSDATEVHVVTEDSERGSFSAILGRDGRVVGALGWNEPVGLRKLRAYVVKRANWTEAVCELPSARSLALI